MDIYSPTSEQEVAEIIADHANAARPLDVVGQGTKRSIGRATESDAVLGLERLRGVTFYEPTELVMSALAGTPLSVVNNELDKHNQHLVFEPLHVSLLFHPEATGTIGGVAATNLSGARRVVAGGARDSLLGIRAVNGRGETFKSGGRVMKNVTGYDLPRGLAGSWGTLAVFTELTFKVLPKPEETATLLIKGQPDQIAVELLCEAMATPYEVSGAVHIEESLVKRLDHEVAQLDSAITAFRIENVASSARYRIEKLRQQFTIHGVPDLLDNDSSLRFWSAWQALSVFRGNENPVWRISTSPRNTAQIVTAIRGYADARIALDWAASLIWVEVPASADAAAADIRRIVATMGGHATLIRAPVAVRNEVEVFQPLERGLRRLTEGMKNTFDPGAILNPGRMYAGI
ncbi:MAG: FAD-binding protein [Pseudomonadota bacterium]